MKIFSGGKSKLKENSAYRNSKDEENEIHETTNKDIDERYMVCGGVWSGRGTGAVTKNGIFLHISD